MCNNHTWNSKLRPVVTGGHCLELLRLVAFAISPNGVLVGKLLLFGGGR